MPKIVTRERRMSADRSVHSARLCRQTTADFLYLRDGDRSDTLPERERLLMRRTPEHRSVKLAPSSANGPLADCPCTLHAL